jgi:polar amino acid transport system substrate-binding protein
VIDTLTAINSYAIMIRLKFLLFFLLLSLQLLIPTNVVAGQHQFFVGELFPFVYKSDSGELTGSVVDVVTRVMEIIGKPVGKESFRNINWARAIDDVENTPGLGIFCMAKTPQRVAKFKWIGPIARLRLGLVARKESQIIIDTHEDIKEYETGVILNSAPHSMMINEFGVPKDKLTLLHSNEQQIRMLKERRVSMITQSDVGLPFYLNQMGQKVSDYEMVFVLKDMFLYVAFNKETPDSEIEAMQGALELLRRKDSRGVALYDEILAKHAGRESLKLPK